MIDRASSPPEPGDLPLGVITVDGALVVRTWSAWVESASGIPAGDAVGRPLAAVVPDIEARGLLAHVERVARTGEPHVLAPAFHKFLFPCPPAAPSRHFSLMQQLVTLGPLEESGRIVGVMITIEDVTARLDAERTLAEELRSSDPAVRDRAAERIQALAALQAPGAFVDLLRTDDWQARRAAIEGLSRHASRDLVGSLIDALRHEHRDFNVLASALQLLSRIDVDVATPLAALLEEPDPDVRIQAALALGDHPGDVAGRALVSALSDEDVNVRFHAIESLGRLRWSDAVESLAALAESGDYFLAFPALDALSRIADPRVSARLVALLESDELVVPAAEALGRMAGGDVVRPLVAVLDRQGSPAIAIAAALASLHARYEQLYAGGDYIVAEFQSAISPDGARRIVAAADQARSSELHALVLVLGWVPDGGAEQALIALLERADVRAEALETLVMRGGPHVVSALVEQLAHDDEEVQLAALAGLGRLGDRAAVRAVVDMLGRGHAVTITAAGALAHIGDASALDDLFGLLTEPDPAVRQAAIGALNSLGHPGMEERVAALLAGTDARGRESAVRIAGYFGYPACADTVLACCDDPDAGVRRAAVEQLPYLLEDRALPLLAGTLERDAPRVRAAAAGALGHVAGSGDALERGLGDDDPWVRYFCARSLGRIRHEGAVGALARTAAADAAPHVRIAAIEAIGAIGGAAAVGYLEPHVRSGDPVMMAAAVGALGLVGEDDAVPVLAEALKSPDAAVRMAAAGALAARGDAEAVSVLHWTAGTEPDQHVARAGLDALSRVAASRDAGWEDAVKALLDLSAEPALRELTVKALAVVPEKRASHVAAGLAHAAGSVRTAAIDALMRMKAPSASALVRDALGHEDPAVREAAVIALDRVGARGVTETFTRMASQDPSAHVRRAAAAAASHRAEP